MIKRIVPSVMVVASNCERRSAATTRCVHFGSRYKEEMRLEESADGRIFLEVSADQLPAQQHLMQKETVVGSPPSP